jgi:amino acid transporter
MLTGGGTQNTWNDAFKGGFWNAFIMLFISGLAYMMMTLSKVEMASALPFSGGIYGHVRALVGPFAGVICAFCDLTTNVLFMALSASELGAIARHSGHSSSDLDPLICFLIFALSSCSSVL